MLPRSLSIEHFIEKIRRRSARNILIDNEKAIGSRNRFSGYTLDVERQKRLSIHEFYLNTQF
jgi:hypothetical protein